MGVALYSRGPPDRGRTLARSVPPLSKPAPAVTTVGQHATADAANPISPRFRVCPPVARRPEPDPSWIRFGRDNRVHAMDIEILKRASRLLRPGGRTRKIVFRLIRGLAVAGVDVAVACRVLEVCRSGYHEWRDCSTSAAATTTRQLATAIFEWIEAWYNPRRRTPALTCSASPSSKLFTAPPPPRHDQHATPVRETGSVSLDIAGHLMRTRHRTVRPISPYPSIPTGPAYRANHECSVCRDTPTDGRRLRTPSGHPPTPPRYRCSATLNSLIQGVSRTYRNWCQPPTGTRRAGLVRPANRNQNVKQEAELPRNGGASGARTHDLTVRQMHVCRSHGVVVVIAAKPLSSLAVSSMVSRSGANWRRIR